MAKIFPKNMVFDDAVEKVKTIFSTSQSIYNPDPFCIEFFESEESLK